MESVSLLISITSVLITSFVAVAFTDETYEFGKDCDKHITKYLDEGDKIYVQYNGENVERRCNAFQFKGEGDDLLDEYKVCLTPVYFSDPDCHINLKISSSYFGLTGSDHTISCHKNTNEKYCGSQDKTLYIEYNPILSSWSTSRASFKLLVTAQKVYDYNDHYGALVGAIVGGVIGGLILITTVIAVFCWCVCRRKPSQGRVLNPVQVPYVIYSSQLQQNNAGDIPTTGNASAPVSQPSVQNQTTGTTYSQPPVNEWSPLPQIYNGVMESSTNK